LQVRAAVAATLPDGRVWNCGGRNNNIQEFDSCYEYNVNNNDWEEVRLNRSSFYTKNIE
jgi:hypothetical protein